MNQNERQCIYCWKIAEKTFFNKEHIVPYSMIRGKAIQKNITLTPSLHKYCVCQECNSYFDKEFDRFLGRDSIDALLRSEYGLLKTGTTIGSSSRLSIQTTDGSRISISQEATEKVARYLPQVRILNKATQEYNYFKIDQLSDLLANNNGLTFEAVNCSENDMRRIESIVNNCGKKISLGNVTQEPDRFNNSLQIQSKMDIDTLYERVIAKIAFNYLAFVLDAINPSLIMEADFDAVRNFVRCGEKPNFSVSEIIGQQIKKQVQAKHNVSLLNSNIYMRKVLVANVSLFNLLPWKVTLVDNYRSINDNLHTEHEWDLTNSICKQIH